MKSFRTLFLGLALLATSRADSSTPAATPLSTAAVSPHTYRNLFQEYLGKSDAEVTAKLEAAVQQYFHGDENSQALLYPVAGDMAYVPDINNQDVRTEGLSYAMMIAVQMNRQKEFNQIWKFAKHYLYHADGAFRGYFAWHAAFDGRKLSNGPAPDGEEWFVMALFFASHRWANGDGIFNYGAEAQFLLHTMLHKDEEPDHDAITPMFDRRTKEIVFTPNVPGSTFTDPSYHLPAFYELWARWAADPADRAFLADAANVSRELFKKAAYPKTGLMPDYSEFDGTPRATAWGGHQDFLYDAWRTLSNPAIDHAWWAADPWEVEQSNRVLRFLASHGKQIPDRYRLDGTPISSTFNAPGLIAMAASAALASDRDVGEPFVRELWEMPLPTGRFRYYNGLLTLIGLLEVSGHFRVYGPPSAP